MNFNASTSLEWQQVGDSLTTDNARERINGYARAGVSIDIPRFLSPFWKTRVQKKWLHDINARTSINTSISYISRPEYARLTSNAAINYTWSTSEEKFFSLSPLDINVIKRFRIDPVFRSSITDPIRLLSLSPDAFLSSVLASYTYTTLRLENLQNQDAKYFSLRFEFGGLINGVLDAFNATPIMLSDSSLSSRYLRLNIDYRKYWKLGRNTQFVFRASGGAIYPFIDYVPFEKFFFTGGSQNNRGWPSRLLGPGSGTGGGGDIGLGVNLEFRSMLSKKIHWAYFFDISQCLVSGLQQLSI